MAIMNIQKTTIESGVTSEGFNKIKFKPASLSGIRNSIVNVPFKKEDMSYVLKEQSNDFEIIDFFDKVSFDEGYTPIKVSNSKFKNIKDHGKFEISFEEEYSNVESNVESYSDVSDSYSEEVSNIVEIDNNVENNNDEIIKETEEITNVVDFDSYLKNISETSNAVDELKKNALAAKKEADATSEELKNVEAMNNSMRVELEEAENKAREIDKIFYERIRKQEQILNARKKEYSDLENQSTETKRYNEKRIAELGNQNDSMSKRLEKLMESTSAREKILAALEEINYETVDYSEEESSLKKVS